MSANRQDISTTCKHEWRPWDLSRQTESTKRYATPTMDCTAYGRIFTIWAAIGGKQKETLPSRSNRNQRWKVLDPFSSSVRLRVWKKSRTRYRLSQCQSLDSCRERSIGWAACWLLSQCPAP